MNRMRHPLLPIVFAAAAAIGIPAVAQQADPPAPPATQPTIEQLKAEQRRVIELQFGSRPVLGEYTIEQVLQIGVEDGRLTVDTKLPGTSGDQRVVVTDDPGLWRVVVHQGNNARPGPSYMVVERYDFSDPANIFSHAMVTASTTQLSIAGALEEIGGMTQVELLDRSPMVTPEEGIVDTGGLRLFVNGFDTEGNRTVSLRLEAADLPSLREAHGDVVNRYLRPVLQRLGAENLLSVDSRLAWLVLGRAENVDPKTMEQVNALLPRLDADAFTEREAAVAELRKLGDQAVLALRHLDRRQLSPEQNARIDEVLEEYQRLDEAKVAAMASDVDFLLDVLLSQDRALRELALKRLNELKDQPISFDVDAPPQQRAERVAVLRAALAGDAPADAGE